MKALRTVLRRYISVLFVASAAFISTPFTASAEQASTQAREEGFELSTDQGTISLKATNAPLKPILDRIGQELNLNVDAQVADDQTVTDEFQALPLDQALRRLAPNRAIISDKSNGEITKIVIMPEGVAGSNGISSDEKELTEPFKFEFDPSAVIQK